MSDIAPLRQLLLGLEWVGRELAAALAASGSAAVHGAASLSAASPSAHAKRPDDVVYCRLRDYFLPDGQGGVGPGAYQFYVWQNREGMGEKEGLYTAGTENLDIFLKHVHAWHMAYERLGIAARDDAKTGNTWALLLKGFPADAARLRCVAIALSHAWPRYSKAQPALFRELLRALESLAAFLYFSRATHDTQIGKLFSKAVRHRRLAEAAVALMQVDPSQDDAASAVRACLQKRLTPADASKYCAPGDTPGAMLARGVLLHQLYRLGDSELTARTRLALAACESELHEVIGGSADKCALKTLELALEQVQGVVFADARAIHLPRRCELAKLRSTARSVTHGGSSAPTRTRGCETGAGALETRRRGRLRRAFYGA